MKARTFRIIGALALACTSFSSLQAQDAGADSPQAPKPKQSQPAEASGSVGSAAIAVRDPQTGKLRAATAAERRALLGQLAGRTSSVARLTSVGPNGAHRAVVAPDHIKALAVRRAADGSLVYGHVSSAQELRAFSEAEAKTKEVRNDR